MGPTIRAEGADRGLVVRSQSRRSRPLGPMRHLGSAPDSVAKVIEKALKARKPRIRYTVTASAKMSIATRRLIGARAWDAAMKTQFPQPKATKRE